MSSTVYEYISVQLSWETVIKMLYPLNSVILLFSGVYPKEIYQQAHKNVCKTELFTKVHHRRGNEYRKQSKNNQLLLRRPRQTDDMLEMCLDSDKP